MKIVLLSAASSIHTIRWANGLSTAGHIVHVISQHSITDAFLSSVSVHILPFKGIAGYFSIVPSVRKLLDRIQPDIVNAHYASGYGTTARLVNYHPWILSVWGSDIYSFPRKSFLHKWLVKKNLYSADQIASTSFCMAAETYSLAPRIHNIEITPFGVDTDVFRDLTQHICRSRKIVIGTVKTLKPIYGIDILIKSYAILLKSLQAHLEIDIPEIELRLVGGGEQLYELKSLADNLGVADSVKFIGHVPYVMVPQELSKFDIYVALSRAESFGVAVIEAGAAGLPVVVSDVGGLPEVTVNGKTGFVVPRENPQAAAEALKKLILDASLRQKMGCAGRIHVAENYSWDACIKTMLEVYSKTISNYSRGLNE